MGGMDDNKRQSTKLCKWLALCAARGAGLMHCRKEHTMEKIWMTKYERDGMGEGKPERKPIIP